jgi:hypothetical protein
MPLGYDARAKRLHQSVFVCILLLWPTIACAHLPGDEAGGFVSGFKHPISGLDHVVAMVSVGLWGAQLGAPAIWLLPVAFPMVMAFGGMLGLMGVPLPGIEIGIALSAIGLGGAVATEAQPPLWVGPVEVGWAALRRQFGESYGELRFFRRDVLPSLKLALAVYPEARIIIDEKAGLTLYPSPPPVPERGRRSVTSLGLCSRCSHSGSASDTCHVPARRFSVADGSTVPAFDKATRRSTLCERLNTTLHR